MEENKKLRTVIYCRVSSDKEEQLSSLTTQESLYRYYINNSNNLKLVAVVRECKSGLKTNRQGFGRIEQMAENGEIDLVLVKSISRLSRNTEEILRICKKFLDLNVDIFFEMENIHLKDTSEQKYDNLSTEEVLKTYAYSAQDYSQTISRHVRWGIKRSFESENSGYQNRICYGYKKLQEKIVIDDEQAKTVKEIFSLYASGASLGQIIKTLEEKGIPSPSGKPKWSKPVIKHILSNEKYIGNTVLGKSRTTDYLSGTRKINKGESNLYIHADTHPPIIDTELFEKVQHRQNA